MVLKKEINKGIIKDEELGEVDLSSADEMDKNLKKGSAKSPKSPKVDPSKTIMEQKIEAMKNKENARKEIRSEMLETKMFTTREDVIDYQRKGGLIHGHSSSYPMEAIVIKKEFREMLKNKK